MDTIKKSQNKKFSILFAAYAFIYFSFIGALDALGINNLNIILSSALGALICGLMIYFWMNRSK